MANNRRGGIIYIKVDGEVLDAKGSFSYNLGLPKREAVMGSGEVLGYKETPQVAFIEGEITDRGGLNLEALVQTDNATITLELGNGKVIVLRDAWYSAEGTAQTEEGNIQVRFEGRRGEEIK